MSRVLELAQAYGLPPDLFEKQIMAESSGNPRAVSPKGAMGMGQLMPATAKMYNVTDPFDPDQNLRASANYMADLVKQYNGNYSAALAHYNGGTRAGRAVAAGGEAPYEETRNYLNKIQGGKMNTNFPGYQQQQLLNPLDTTVKKSMLPNAQEYAAMNAEKVDRLPLAMAAMLSGDRRISALGGALFKDGNAAQGPDKLSAYMSLNPDGSILQVGNPDSVLIAQMKADAAKAKGRPLPFSATQSMSKQASSVDVLGGLANNFQDKFAGVTPFGTLGEVENWAASRFPKLGMQEQGQWWKQYADQTNIVRNELFGSALTATEKAAFDKANIDPGMSPSEIRTRLRDQQAAAAAAYNKLLDAASGGGFDVSGHQYRTPLVTPPSASGPPPGGAPMPPGVPGATPGAAPTARDLLNNVYK